MRNGTVGAVVTSNEISLDLLFERLVTKKQLAERLAVSVSFINKLMTQGLPFIALGRAVRFRISEVVEFLNRRKKP